MIYGMTQEGRDEEERAAFDAILAGREPETAGRADRRAFAQSVGA